MIAMGYTILWLHRRKLMKMQMDEAIEYLQIYLAVDFGMDIIFNIFNYYLFVFASVSAAGARGDF